MTAYKRFGEELIGPIGPSGPTGTGFDDLSGTSFQMAYFNTSTELYGTPDAEILGNQIVCSDGTAALPVISFQSNSTTGIYSISNNAIGFSTNAGEKVSIWDTDSGDYINGINIGETSLIGGIQRLSANPSNSWQDGNCGNSSALVFASSDFTNVDIRNGPRSWGSAPGTGRSVAFGGYMEGSAGSQGNAIVAIKLLPKGFLVEGTVVVSSSFLLGLAPTWNSGTIELFTQDINTPSLTPVSLGPVVTMNGAWLAGKNIQYVANTSAVGNGTRVIVVKIIIPSGDRIILNDSLVGVQVPIERI